MADRALQDLTDVEIKSIIYDESLKIRNAQNNINLLEQELIKRAELNQRISQASNNTPRVVTQ